MDLGMIGLGRMGANMTERRASLDGVQPYVADSGEGRWSAAEAIELDVAAPVITVALQARLRSRDERSFSDRLPAVLREEFGSHAVRCENA